MLKLLHFFFPIRRGCLIFVLIAFALTVFVVSRNQIRNGPAVRPPATQPHPLPKR